MNSLTYSDKQIIENLLQMSGGYVLNFSDSTFSDFFKTVVNINIDDDKYREYGGSKAKRLRSFLGQESDENISLVLSELIKLIPLQNPQHSPQLLAQLSETIQRLKKKSIKRTHTVLGTEQATVWADDKVKLFISHRDSSKKAAAALADNLNNLGFACFVAHDTIEPMLQWKNVIESALRSMDGMICFLTTDYYQSTWTNQEFGYAIAKGVPIYQYCFEKVDPQGFRMDIQAIRQGEDKLKSILINDFNTHPAVRENILTEFLSAKDGSFFYAKKQFINLLQIQLDDPDIEQIVQTINGPAKTSINQLRILLSEDELEDEHKVVLKCKESTYRELLVNRVLNEHSIKKYVIENYVIKESKT